MTDNTNSGPGSIPFFANAVSAFRSENTPIQILATSTALGAICFAARTLLDAKRPATDDKKHRTSQEHVVQSQLLRDSLALLVSGTGFALAHRLSKSIRNIPSRER